MPPAVQQAESWQDALAKAEKARSDGRINPALAAYQRAVDSASGEPTPFLEAGRYVIDLNRDLQTLEALYTTHRKRFGYAEDEYPPRVPGVKIGNEGWEFGLDSLVKAGALSAMPAPLSAEVAAAYDAHGATDRALHWRDNARKADPAFLRNRLDIVVTKARDSAPELSGEASDLLGDFPDEPEALFVAGAAMLAAGNTRDGAAHLTGLLATVPSQDIRFGTWGPRDCQLVDLALYIARHRLETGDFRQALDRAIAEAGTERPDAAAPMLAAAVLLWHDGRLAGANRAFRRALIAEGYHLHPDGPLIANAHLSIRWARAAVAGYRPVYFSADGPGSIDRGRLVEALALEQATIGKPIGAYLDGAYAFRAHYVHAIPRRIEHVPGYKLTTEQQKYYAIPSSVTHFTIRWGKVFAISPTQVQRRVQLPPYLMGIALWAWPKVKRARANMRLLKRRAMRFAAVWGRFLQPQLEAIDRVIPVGSKLVMPILRFLVRLRRAMRQPGFWNPKDWVSRLLWMRYRVRGAVVADTREALLAAIAARKEQAS